LKGKNFGGKITSWTVVGGVCSVPVSIRVVLLLAAIFIPSIAAFAQTVPLFHVTEKPGPNSVGLKVVEQYDYSSSSAPIPQHTSTQ
jgi:hypothetical protein